MGICWEDISSIRITPEKRARNKIENPNDAMPNKRFSVVSNGANNELIGDIFLYRKRLS